MFEIVHIVLAQMLLPGFALQGTSSFIRVCFEFHSSMLRVFWFGFTRIFTRPTSTNNGSTYCKNGDTSN